jgi:hypothetical protein
LDFEKNRLTGFLLLEVDLIIYNSGSAWDPLAANTREKRGQYKDLIGKL